MLWHTHTYTHTVVLIVQVCGQFESMHYIFPMNFQKHQSHIVCNLQLSVEATSASLWRFSFVHSDWSSVPFKEGRTSKTSQYSRLRHVQTSSNHNFFFWQWRTQFLKEKKKKTVKFQSSSSLRADVLCFDACWNPSHTFLSSLNTLLLFSNGVLGFLSPPWYSIGTVLDNVKDTKNNKYKRQLGYQS